MPMRAVDMFRQTAVFLVSGIRLWHIEQSLTCFVCVRLFILSVYLEKIMLRKHHSPPEF